MKLPSEKGNYELPPEATHQAICVEIVDYGTQPQSYMGETKPPAHEVRFGWRLIGEQQADGRPFHIGKDYLYSMGKKSNFRKMMEAWIPKSVMDAAGGAENFDIKSLLNKGCLLTITHAVSAAGNDYAKIASISSFAKGMAKAAPVDDTLYFSLQADEFKEDDFDRVPQWMQDKIKASPEWAALHAPKRQNGGMSQAAMDKQEFTEKKSADSREIDMGPNLDDEIPF